jgi:hypothetical protein
MAKAFALSVDKTSRAGSVYLRARRYLDFKDVQILFDAFIMMFLQCDIKNEFELFLGEETRRYLMRRGLAVINAQLNGEYCPS